MKAAFGPLSFFAVLGEARKTTHTGANPTAKCAPMRSLALLLLLPACAAAVQVGTPGPDPSPTIMGEGTPGSAEILITRPNEAGLITQVAETPVLLLDGQSVGTCRFGAPLRLRLPEGSYEVTALTENGEESQWIVLEEGEAVSLRCGVLATPNVTPMPRLDRVAAG